MANGTSIRFVFIFLITLCLPPIVAEAATNYEVGTGQSYSSLDNLINSVVIHPDMVINIHTDDSSLYGDTISMPGQLTFRSADGTKKNISQATGIPASRGGIFRFDDSSILTLENLRFQNSEVTGNDPIDGGQGAAIYSYQSFTINANNVEFLNNTAYGGVTMMDGAQGAAIISKTDMTLDGWSNILFQQNRVFAADNSESSGLGGAIFTLDDLSMRDLSNVSFIGNEAHGGNANNGAVKQTGIGGALGQMDLWSPRKMTLTGTNILFDGNRATAGNVTGNGSMAYSGLGGAIFTNQEAVMSGVTFTNNMATTEANEMTSGLGGAIYYAGPSLTMNAENGNNILFRGNTHNPGNTGVTPNSIYFGAIDDGSDTNNVTFALNVDANSKVEMFDPLGSQADDLQSGTGGTPVRTNLTVEKNGAGTWVLGGHNLMESSTTWNVNQGTLFMEMVNNTPVHIDLRSPNTASFNLASGTSLLINPGTTAHMISARDINLAAGTTTGLWDGKSFSYDRLPVAAEVPLLSLRATETLVNESTILNPDGSFSSGIYDYDYGLYWRENDSLSQDLVAYLRSETFNQERGGVGALAAAGATNISTHGAINQIHQRRLALNFQYFDECIDTIYPLNHPEGITNPCQDEYRLWATPSYNYVSSNTSSNYRISTPGVAVGIDKSFKDKFFLGLGVFGFWPDYRSDYADVDGQSVHAMLYGGALLPARLELGLNAGFGYSWYDQKRSVSGEKYDSEYDSKSWNIGANLGRRFPLSEFWELRPFVDYQYLRVDVDGYKEDAGQYALNVGKHHEKFHLLRAGTDLSYSIAGTHEIRGKVYYSGLYGDDKAKTNVRFVMDPNQTSYASYGDRYDRDALGLGLDGVIRLTEMAEITAKYEVEFSNNTTSHYGGLTFVLKF